MVRLLTSPERSALMAKVATKNTGPERKVRSALFAAGFRFRLHDKRLPGSPDLVLPRFRTVVFVNGCFWHGHSCPKGRRPKSNADYWGPKIDQNVERDFRNRAALEGMRWFVYEVWTCQLEADVSQLLSHLQAKRAESGTEAHSAPT